MPMKMKLGIWLGLGLGLCLFGILAETNAMEREQS